MLCVRQYSQTERNQPKWRPVGTALLVESKERSKKKKQNKERKRIDTQVYSSINYVDLQLGGGKMLPVNHWSSSGGNRKSSSALLTFLLHKRLLWKQTQSETGLIRCPVYVAAHCWCAILLDPQEVVHTLSFTDVCITTAGGGGQMAWGGRPSQPWHFSESRSHHSGEKERSLLDKLWFNVRKSSWWAEFELCGSSWRLDGTYECFHRPHTESPLPYPITSYNFGVMLCLSFHNSKMTRQRETKHCKV